MRRTLLWSLVWAACIACSRESPWVATKRHPAVSPSGKFVLRIIETNSPNVPGRQFPFLTFQIAKRDDTNSEYTCDIPFIATHILAFEGDSKVYWFEGNWSEYDADRKKRLGAAAERPHRIRYRSLTRA